MRRIIVVLLVVTNAEVAAAQQPSAGPESRNAPVVFVNVNLIRMDTDRVEPAQTVIVSGDRIAVVGAAAEVPVPKGATVIDGAGRYLVPGLTDAHVHLTTDMPWAPARRDFGDAPLYLAHGVTTVINLRGTPEQLDWRRRINAGELTGPTIYTSGEFINEPRVKTPDEIAQEIAAQHRAGYDLIKFHEIFTPQAGFITTTGLSRAAYLKMNDAAREIGMPLVGHAPVNLGLDALLQARQPLAHIGMLSNIYFLPAVGNRRWLLVTAASLVALTILLVGSGISAVVRRWRAATPSLSRLVSRARSFAALAGLCGMVAAVSAFLFLPGGPLFESVGLRLLFSSSIVLMTFIAVIGLVLTAAVWHDPGAAPGTRMHLTLASAASLAFVCAAVVFWLPVIWRSSDAGMRRLASRVHDAGITVQTTLVVYDALGGSGWLRLARDPTIDYLRADTRALWHRLPQPSGPPYRLTDFMKKVASALHQAGVPLMAGTDAMGIPLVAPGSSLHRELELLVESGLTPYEAMRAATVVPASFLGKEKEFGTIAPGKRADLLLIDGNPLEDVTRLRHPVGVMTRGRWLTRDALQQMLTALAQGQ